MPLPAHRRDFSLRPPPHPSKKIPVKLQCLFNFFGLGEPLVTPREIPMP